MDMSKISTSTAIPVASPISSQQAHQPGKLEQELLHAIATNDFSQVSGVGFCVESRDIDDKPGGQGFLYRRGEDLHASESCGPFSAGQIYRHLAGGYYFAGEPQGRYEPGMFIRVNGWRSE